jgi:hypothetical protein
VLAARDDREELGKILTTFDNEHGLGTDDQATLAVLRAIAGDDAAGLGAAICRTDDLYGGLRIELGVLAARRGALDDDRRQQLIELARDDLLWSARIGEL